MKTPKIIFICHEATRTGVPVLSLKMIRWMKANLGITPFIILLTGGPLESEFRKEGRVVVWNPAPPAKDRKQGDLAKVMHRLKRMASRITNRALLKREVNDSGIVYLNTVAALRFYHAHADLFTDHKKVLHVHEMMFTIGKFVPENIAYRFREFDRIIVVNKAINSYFLNLGIDPSRILQVTEYLNDIAFPAVTPKKDDGVFRVLSVGLGSWRKGIDLFVQTAWYFSCVYSRPFEFTWVGHISPQVLAQLRYEIGMYRLEGKVHFAGEVPDTSVFFSSHDVFFLSSREDPYPLVMLEATHHELPVVYFSGSGGADEFINDDTLAVPPFDVAGVANRLADIAANYPEAAGKARLLQQKIPAHAIGVVAGKITDHILSK